MLRLADHVRACCVDDHVVLLDLRRGRYLGVGGPQLALLPRAIQDWPTPGNARPSADASDPAKLDPWLASLQHQGLLTEEPARHPVPLHLDEPVASLDADTQARFEWRTLMRLWRASAQSALWLRRRSLEDIAAAIAAQRRAPPPPDDLPALQRAVASYLHVRPFAFTAHDRCLHDSLTLVRYLEGQDLFPRWVIGVRARPFGAHAWVQSGGTVLNDLHEHVRRYQPILVV